jgi:hypothetical protein
MNRHSYDFYINYNSCDVQTNVSAWIRGIALAQGRAGFWRVRILTMGKRQKRQAPGGVVRTDFCLWPGLRADIESPGPWIDRLAMDDIYQVAISSQLDPQGFSAVGVTATGSGQRVPSVVSDRRQRCMRPHALNLRGGWRMWMGRRGWSDCAEAAAQSWRP